MLQLRSYQQATVDHCVDWAASAQPGNSIVIAAPTGVGKSFVELALQARLPNSWIITPRLEIARGFLDKLGEHPDNLQDLVRCCWANRICTPIRFRNALFRGDIKSISQLIFDEGHHAIADSWRQDWLACGMPPVIIFTASPFRATARSTAVFREQWGEPIWMITLPEAAALGDISIPTFEILPLVDDDVVQVSATGEFDVESLESATNDRLSDAANISVERWYNSGWDRVTCFCLPTVATAKRMVAELDSLGAPAAAVTAKTSDTERQIIFQALKLRKIALCQVSVVGEGVDLPIRRLVDLAPVMSPVKWLQQFGRATRPSDQPPEYVCSNRNLQRHSYLLDGLCPSSKVAEATQAFGGAGARAGHRAIGLESLGRFKATNLKLTDGNEATLYMLIDSQNGRMTEYACLIHPAMQEPVWATREHANNGTERIWGHWAQCKCPAELRGFVSQSPRPPSPKQIDWWKKSAGYYGLDSDAKLTRKNFAALPLCKDLGIKLAGTR